MAHEENELPEARLLLASSRDWFALALEAVLEPEGYRVERKTSVESALRWATVSRPDAVVLDEKLEDGGGTELCRRLVQGPLGGDVPVLLYGTARLGDALYVEAYRAGAWAVLEQPVRPRPLLAALRRMLELGGRVRALEEAAVRDPLTGLLGEEALRALLPRLAAMAEREGAPLSCAVVAPTHRGKGPLGRRQRLLAAELCLQHLRSADVCGWLAGDELAVVAFDTPAEGVERLMARLNRVAAGRAEVSERTGTLSAGIAAVVGDAAGEEEDGVAREEAGTPAAAASAGRVARSLESAREALREALEAGGGIRLGGGAA